MAMGAVSVEATPSQSGASTTIDLAFNTHSVDLNYDFRQILTLEDDRGEKYKMLNWDGGRGGHHLNASATFEPLSPLAKGMILSIDGVDGKTAEFTWNW